MINSWAHLIDLNTEYTHLNLNQNLDYTKYFMYSMIANSTAIEGSTLTENEAQLLFDESIQMLFNIPLTKVFAEDRAKYIEALQISTKNESSEVFIDFMKNQHIKTIQQEIREHIIAQKKNKGFSLIF